jgi:hypothetical protein
VIDPYNELDHARPSSISETEYVSQMLSKLKRFASYNDVHVWFVAHPRQLRDWKGDPPNLYDISGSAHFINKADNGLVIHRPRRQDQNPYEVSGRSRSRRGFCGIVLSSVSLFCIVSFWRSCVCLSFGALCMCMRV